MIEGDLNGVEVFHPIDLRRVIARLGILVFDLGEKCNGTCVPTRIAIGLGIDADEHQPRRFETCLFPQLAPGRVFNGFTDIDEPARQGEVALEWRVFSSNHKDTTGRIDNDAIDREQRRFRRWHGISIYVESEVMKTATSAGLLLYRRREDLEVLLAHPGGPYWRNKDDGAWTVPKGEIGDGEAPYEAAVREFAEETGHVVNGPAHFLGGLRQAGGKRVYVWAVEEDWDPAALVSNRFTIEWPPRSGKEQQFPEIDRAAWFDIRSARSKILKSQSEFLNRLTESLSQST